MVVICDGLVCHFRFKCSRKVLEEYTFGCCISKLNLFELEDWKIDVSLCFSGAFGPYLISEQRETRIDW